MWSTLYSDHHPFIIAPRGNPPLLAAKSFRFESAWLTDQMYHDKVSSCWNYEKSLNQNLRDLENFLSTWKPDMLGEVKAKKKHLLARLDGIQKNMHNDQARGFLLRLEKKLHKELKSINVMWIPPSSGWLKLNTDGASKTSSDRSGCGGLLRGPDGQWIHGFATQLGFCSAYVAELWGVYEGLSFGA